MPIKYKIDNFKPTHLTKSSLKIEKNIQSLKKRLTADKVVPQRVSLWEMLKKLFSIG